MRIISKFRDYYDNAVHASMVDEDVIFVRKTSVRKYEPEVVRLPYLAPGVTYDVKWRKPGYDYQHTGTVTARMVALALAGKTYPLWMIDHEGLTDSDPVVFPSRDVAGRGIVYGAPTLAELQRYLQEAYGENSLVEERKAQTRYPSWSRWGRKRPGDFDHEAYVRNFDSTAACLHYQTPLLLAIPESLNRRYYTARDMKAPPIEGPKVMLNPRLSAFHLQSVIDPYTAWQEISMFIGGVMPGRQSPMVQLSDDSKIAKAGFDPKYSFRRRPNT